MPSHFQMTSFPPYIHGSLTRTYYKPIFIPLRAGAESYQFSILKRLEILQFPGSNIRPQFGKNFSTIHRLTYPVFDF